MQNKTFDLNKVRQLTQNGTLNDLLKDYAPAYIITNENLRGDAKIAPAQRVLTVAGSGDQALFYTLAGARHVDTFDMSFCARTVQDVKVAAIMARMTRDEYINLVSDLRRTPRSADIAQLTRVTPHMPHDTAMFVRELGTHFFFSAGCSMRAHSYNIPTDAEYEKLCAMVKRPFNFIWTDLANLHAHLDGEYDVINLSNIFDYGVYDLGAKADILKNLAPHVRVGGFIAYPSQWYNGQFENIALENKQNGAKIVHHSTARNDDKFSQSYMILFQRTW